MAGATRRPVRPDDEPFLRVLDAGARRALFDGWDDAAAAQMLALQFDARRAGRQGAREQIVVLAGRPIGTLVTSEGAEGLHILDLALVPEARGLGLGSAVLRELLADGRPARVEVEASNRAALRLYERIGFRREGDGDGVTITLRRASDRATD